MVGGGYDSILSLLKPRSIRLIPPPPHHRHNPLSTSRGAVVLFSPLGPQNDGSAAYVQIRSVCVVSTVHSWDVRGSSARAHGPCVCVCVCVRISTALRDGRPSVRW